MYYRNKAHQKRFEKLMSENSCRCSGGYLAGVYLLTSDEQLWKAVKYLLEEKVIDFSKIYVRDFTTNSYTIFTVAKDIYSGETHITLQDICDEYIVHEKLFNLFITALYICRFGYTYIGIEKVFN